MSDIVNIGIKQRGFVDLSLMDSAMSESEIIANQTSYILLKGAIMVGITLIIILFNLFTGYISSKMSADMSLKLRREIFLKIMNFSYDDFDKFSASSLITRATSDVENLKSMIITFTRIAILPIVIAAGTFMALQKSVAMSGIMAGGAFGATVCVVICFLLIIPKIKIFQKLFDNFNAIIKERLSGVQLIRIFGREKFECEKFKKSNEKLTSTSLFINKITIMIAPFITIIINLMTVFIIWVGAENISTSCMNIGDLMAFLQYSTIVITAFINFSVMISSISKFWVSAERIFEILDIQTVKKTSDKKLISNINTIAFENVGFKYPEAQENVLKNIDFSISSGQTIAVTGTTGSGKSTFVKLLLGLYSPNEGSIMINGVNLKNINKESFLQRISYVPQNEMLFSGSIEKNLRIAKECASQEELIDSLNIAQMSNFLSENGLDFKILKNGSNISGGQRQRIAIARAINKDADVYIFDDCFSRLDFITDLNLRKAIGVKLNNAIKIMISQRISSIKNSDYIIVLDEGKISGIGTHTELLKNCEVYRKMAELCLGKEEII